MHFSFRRRHNPPSPGTALLTQAMHIATITTNPKNEAASEWDLPGTTAEVPQNNSTSTTQFQPQPAYENSRSRIPAELYRTIFMSSSQRDLSRLCLVSRAMSHEAQYMLYRDVDLHDCPEWRVLKWANAVTDSPRLSRILQSLCISSTFPDHESVTYQSSGDATLYALKSALKGAINLIGFTARQNSLEAYMNTIDLSVLDDCSHRLRRFIIRGEIIFFGRRIVNFYSTMPNLVEWTADPNLVRAAIPQTLLQSINVVDMHLFTVPDTRLLEFVMTRRIQCFRMDVAEFLTRADVAESAQAIKNGLACRTLTHLQIETDGSSSIIGEPPQWTSMNIAETFALQFSTLKFLCLKASHRNDIVSFPLMTQVTPTT